MSKLSPEVSSVSKTNALRLAVVFGVLTFLQGVAEPTEGLVSQPVRSLIASRGPRPAAAVTTFAAIMSIPWALKPLLGVMVDFARFGAKGRALFVALAGAIWGAVFLALGVSATASQGPSTLLACLLIATLAAALADVATDALVVDWGQAQGLTGRYQGVVWMAAYASGIATGFLGGKITATHRPQVAYLASGACGLAMLAIALAGVTEPRASSRRPRWAEQWRTLVLAVRSPAVRSVALFLAISNLNPVTNPILQLHMTGALGLSEPFFGTMLSLFSVTAMLAAGAYTAYSARLPIRGLAYGSVVFGAVGNLAYLPMTGERSAAVATAIAGFCYMTCTLVQFDLAARACPRDATATVFASFMALSNLVAALATSLGGVAYERISADWGGTVAFDVLIVVGAVAAVAAALVIPWFPRYILSPAAAESGV